MRELIGVLETSESQAAEPDAGEAARLVDRAIEAYIGRCRARIPSFVGENFSLAQTWKLQRPTVWFDLGCAPVNAAWALPHLAIVKAAETAERVGYPRLARWAQKLPPGIRTGYQRRIDRLIREALLGWDPGQSSSTLPREFLRELDAAPSLRRRIDAPESADAAGRTPARSLAALLQQFSAGRAAVSDLAGTVLTLAASWLLLGTTSLSWRSIAHGAAQRSAHDRAASRFFLGKKLGSAFYNVFPPAVSEFAVWTNLVLLGAALTAGAMICTILSDPVRKLLGFQRNRLEALVDDVERELIVHCHRRIRRPVPDPDDVTSIPRG